MAQRPNLTPEDLGVFPNQTEGQSMVIVRRDSLIGQVIENNFDALHPNTPRDPAPNHVYWREAYAWVPTENRFECIQSERVPLSIRDVMIEGKILVTRQLTDAIIKFLRNRLPQRLV